MARMLGKTNRVKGCPYGCCVPDHMGYGRKNKRHIVRKNRRTEKLALSDRRHT